MRNISCPGYLKLEVSDGAATGEVHFLSEPKYPSPIASTGEANAFAPESSNS